MEISYDVGNLGASGRCVLAGSCRRRFLVDANAHLSLVLQAVQKDRVVRPVSSGPMHMPQLRPGGLCLWQLRELEHLPNFELALRRLFVEERCPGRRVPPQDVVVEVSQSGRLVVRKSSSDG
jgi:hypothetical protein